MAELDRDLETIKQLLDKHGLTPKQLDKLLEPELAIPVSIFKSDVGPLGALCLYLKENKGLRIAEIARLLNRDQRTIWATHANSKGKKVIVESGLIVDVKIFADRRVSVMEALVYHLKTIHHMRLVDIAKMLERSNKTVWCFYHRALKKHEK